MELAPWPEIVDDMHVYFWSLTPSLYFASIILFPLSRFIFLMTRHDPSFFSRDDHIFLGIHFMPLFGCIYFRRYQFFSSLFHTQPILEFIRIYFLFLPK